MRSDAGIDRPAHRVGRVAVRRNRQAGLVRQSDGEVQPGRRHLGDRRIGAGRGSAALDHHLDDSRVSGDASVDCGGDIGLGRDLAAPEVAVGRRGA